MMLSINHKQQCMNIQSHTHSYGVFKIDNTWSIQYTLHDNMRYIIFLLYR